MGILVMQLDLIEDQASHFLAVDLVKIYYFFEQTWVLLLISIARENNILVLGVGPTQGLEHALTAEKCIQLFLLLRGKNFVWACTTMGQIITYLLMLQKFTNLKQKILIL